MEFELTASFNDYDAFNQVIFWYNIFVVNSVDDGSLMPSMTIFHVDSLSVCCFRWCWYTDKQKQTRFIFFLLMMILFQR